MFYRFFSITIVSLFFATSAFAQVIPQELVLGDIKIALPAPVRPLIQAKIQELRGDNASFAQKLEQADLFLPIVSEVLEENGVPEVFKYLAFFDHKNPQDNLFWQIPEDLSHKLGLQDEDGIDESANLVKVAQSVAQHLKKNQGSLKNWLLTLISYHESVGNAQNYFTDKLEQINLQNLILNKKLDVSKALHPDVLEFVANWVLFKDAIGRNPNAPTTLARYKTPENKSLKQIAEEFQIKLSDLEAHNDWLEAGKTIPAGKGYEVLIPLSTYSPSTEVQVETLRGGELEFNTYEEDSFNEAPEEITTITTQKTHTVSRGETLYAIARKYNVTIQEIRQWNLMGLNHVLKVGESVKIQGNLPTPKQTTETTKKTTALSPKVQKLTPATVQAGKTHTVTSGETLFKIARTYQVSVGEIRTWNKLTSDNLKIGQKITIKTPQAPKNPPAESKGTVEDNPPKPTPAEKPFEKPIEKPTQTGLAYHQRALATKIVPTEMSVLNMRLSLTSEARQKVQQYVNKLTESPLAYFRQLELLDGYMPLIERELQKAGIPLDFRLLPIQESALKATAVSKSNAVGYWQFKEASAIEEGLIVNVSIDERMNIVSSTLGAINYLKKSQLMFGNWVNSLLSYNMGRTGAKNHIAKTYKNQNLQGVQLMTIHADTHWYILKFLAHMIAFDDELGISTPNKLLTDYTQGAKKTLAQIAKDNQTTLETIKPHNQWLKTSAVPVGKPFPVIVPER